MKDFILASASPRRREILHSAGFTFTVIPSSVKEPSFKGGSVISYVEGLAEIKAKDVFSRQTKPCLGADTIVVFDGNILGKPANRSINEQYLRMLSGKSHYVYTGFALVCPTKISIGYDVTEVFFNTLSDDFIHDYVASGDGLDKAGGYGIQNGSLVQRIIGSYTNVVGLPIEKITKLLKEELS